MGARGGRGSTGVPDFNVVVTNRRPPNGREKFLIGTGNFVTFLRQHFLSAGRLEAEGVSFTY